MAWASSKGWLTKRSVPSTSPSSAIRTMVVLRRCRSIPTYCPIGASSSFEVFFCKTEHARISQGAEAPPLHRISSRLPVPGPTGSQEVVARRPELPGTCRQCLRLASVRERTLLISSTAKHGWGWVSPAGARLTTWNRLSTSIICGPMVIAFAPAAIQGLDRRIPTCPEWDMAALVAHVGSGHRWFADIVQARATEDPRRFPSAPTDTRALLTWYDEGFVGLIEVLSAIPPDEPIWNWFDNKPAPARFWHRRASLETAVHRWDAQLATGMAEPVDPELAVDGIDEHLAFMSFFFQFKLIHVDGLTGSLHLHTTDTEGEWLLNLAPDRIDHSRSHAKAAAALQGPSSDLLLWLVNRRSPDSPELRLFGDRKIIESWRSISW